MGPALHKQKVKAYQNWLCLLPSLDKKIPPGFATRLKQTLFCTTAIEQSAIFLNVRSRCRTWVLFIVLTVFLGPPTHPLERVRCLLLAATIRQCSPSVRHGKSCTWTVREGSNHKTDVLPKTYVWFLRPAVHEPANPTMPRSSISTDCTVCVPWANVTSSW